MATVSTRYKPTAKLKVAKRLAPAAGEKPVVAAQLAPSVIETPCIVEPQSRGRPVKGLLGTLSGGVISSILHCTLFVVFTFVTVNDHFPPPAIQISAARGLEAVELEELVREHVEMKVLPLARQEFQLPESVSGNETNLSDVGGAPDSSVSVVAAEVAGAVGLLDSDLRKALVNGLGGPGAEGGQLGRRDASFAGLVAYSQEHGLDVVIVMDSTGSMGGEIENVKRKIMSIGGALLKKVPETRLSIVSYKDQEDDYVAKGLPLTSDLAEVQTFLKGVRAGGGGDPPEAVECGLEWAISENTFRPTARKVILLFGDQPSHDKDTPRCLLLAAEFQREHGGTVSTITCRKAAPIPQFYEIARSGGGEAFILKDSRRIMEELIVLMFGNRHRKDVAEFFDLDAANDPAPAASVDAAARPVRKNK